MKMLGRVVRWVTFEIRIWLKMLWSVSPTTTSAVADLARFLQLRKIVDMWGWCSRNFSMWMWLLGALRLQKVLPDWKNGASRRSSMAQQPWKRATNWFDRWRASIRIAQDWRSPGHWDDLRICCIFRWRDVGRFDRVCQSTKQSLVLHFPEGSTYSRYWTWRAIITGWDRFLRTEN